MNRLIVGLTVALLLTAVVATSVSASSDDVVRSPDGTAFKGDTTPGTVPVCRVDGGEATVSSLSLAYMFYNCDIWFNYVYQPTNESSVEGWSWTEVHETSDYDSPMVEVDSIYANQRLWKDSTLIDSDLHSAITNAASDEADVYRGGCSPTDPMFFWFRSTSYHQASDSYYGTAYSTASDGF